MNSNYYVTVKSNNRTGKVSMASIRDVARRAGLGVGTVSRVINGNGYVSADTKKKIEKAIEELEYTPNELARNLFRNKTGIVGILVPDVDHPFFSSYVRQTEAALYEVGYKTLISSTIGVSNREEEFLDMLDRNMVDGISAFLHRRNKLYLIALHTGHFKEYFSSFCSQTDGFIPILTKKNVEISCFFK